MLRQRFHVFFIVFILFSSFAIGKPLNVIGLMSGTSMDGIDIAFIQTDGETVYKRGPGETYAFPPKFKDKLRVIIKKADHATEKEILALEKEYTELNAKVVMDFIQKHHLKNINLVGFHGQTVWHKPEKHATRQMGDGKRLAQLIKINVVNNFRTADMKAHGQGAPLAPVYHQALAKGSHDPVVFLNIGGVSNISYIDKNELIAFDTGPGGALIDDWVLKRKNIPYDKNGEIAALGKVNKGVIKKMLEHPYFNQSPPKSLDRNDFISTLNLLEVSSTEDGAATLTFFTAQALKKALSYLPKIPKKWIVCGGGRYNKTLMKMIHQAVKAPVIPIEEIGLNGDFIEAELIAYLAVRSVYGLPLSFPDTTGVDAPTRGGVLHRWS